jgi:hypothetical protein
MNAVPCPREIEVLDALRSGAWPAGCDEELRAHPADCASCRDLVEVATALFADRDASIHEGAFPGSGVIWWKMQMRLRREAMVSARRTLLLVQACALSIAGGLALLMLRLFVPGWTALVASIFPAALRGVGPLLLGVVACVALAAAPLAAYLASRKA